MARWFLLVIILLNAACTRPPSSPSSDHSGPIAQPTRSSRRVTPTPVEAVRSVGSPTIGAIGSPGEPALVVNVIDGDTLTVRIGSREGVVRLIGIDAPERGEAGRPPECYFDAATAALSALAPPGSRVYLERDVSETDRYGRLLRYVWIERAGSWLLVNEELVRQGAALAREYPPDLRYAERLAAAQRDAQRARAGLWSACTTPVPTPPAGPTPTTRTSCDPSYPDICLPPPPPDLDCRDIPYRRFRVLPPDPHNLDSDRDGIGCEAG